MGVIGSRLSSAGVLSIAGEFDEVSQSTITLTLTNQFAAEFDEVTLQGSSLDLTSDVSDVFVGMYGGGGTGVPGVPVELGFSYGGYAFPTAIQNGLVPVGSIVYVRWVYNAYTGSPKLALVNMGVVSTVVKSGNSSYVMVSNPYGVSRPTDNGSFIGSNIVAYDATEVLIVYPSAATKRETSSGVLMVSGYFDEVNKPT